MKALLEFLVRFETDEIVEEAEELEIEPKSPSLASVSKYLCYEWRGLSFQD